MAGRGDGRLVHPSPSPTVTIGLTLGLSSCTLSAYSPSPLSISVTARILTTPHPALPITLQTHPTALSELSNRSFNNITSVKDPSGYIKICRSAGPITSGTPRTVVTRETLFTVPAQEHGGVLTVSHELPRERILAAGLVPGERYRVSLTDKCLGARWWAFKDEKQLEGVRLAAWLSKERIEEERKKVEGIRGEIERGEWPEDQAKEWEMHQSRFGDNPIEMGEKPTELAMVRENEMVEFEVV